VSHEPCACCVCSESGRYHSFEVGGEGCDCSFGLVMIDDGIGRSPFGCHVADSNVAPGFDNR
jgi:hypothetical protein